MSDLMEKEKAAIARFKAFEPEEGYYLAYSSGKDSDTIKILAQLSGVKFEAVHNLTSVDAPETIQYIKNQPDVRIETPRYSDGTRATMWNLIARKKMPPTRIVRYCCEVLKESCGQGRLTVTGVRWAESNKRKANRGLVNVQRKPKTMQKMAEDTGANYRLNKNGNVILNDDNDPNRRMVEQCYRTNKVLLNPIIDWTDEDVWDFLHHYGCESNPLYQCGYKRIGCIGCPMQGRKMREADFERYPKYKQMYINAFGKMLDNMNASPYKPIAWKTANEVFDWWMKDPVKKDTVEKETVKKDDIKKDNMQNDTIKKDTEEIGGDP